MTLNTVALFGDSLTYNGAFTLFYWENGLTGGKLKTVVNAGATTPTSATIGFRVFLKQRMLVQLGTSTFAT